MEFQFPTSPGAGNPIPPYLYGNFLLLHPAFTIDGSPSPRQLDIWPARADRGDRGSGSLYGQHVVDPESWLIMQVAEAQLPSPLQASSGFPIAEGIDDKSYRAQPNLGEHSFTPSPQRQYTLPIVEEHYRPLLPTNKMSASGQGEPTHLQTSTADYPRRDGGDSAGARRSQARKSPPLPVPELPDSWSSEGPFAPLSVRMTKRNRLLRSLKGASFADAPRYPCRCGATFATRTNLARHYRHAYMHEEHEEHGPVKQDPHDASSKKVESTIPPNPVNSTDENERRSARTSTLADRSAHRPQIMSPGSSADSEGDGSRLAGGSEAMSAPEQHEHSNPSVSCNSSAESVSATPELFPNISIPLPTQGELTYATEPCDQATPPSCTLPNAERSSVQIFSSPSHTSPNHATEHEGSLNDGCEIESRSTEINNVNRLVGDDALNLSEPEHMHLDSALCQISEDRKPTCDFGIDCPVAGTENHCEVQQVVPSPKKTQRDQTFLY